MPSPSIKPGDTFGKLTVAQIDGRLLARCECGGTWSGPPVNLRNGNVTSCGCDKVVSRRPRCRCKSLVRLKVNPDGTKEPHPDGRCTRCARKAERQRAIERERHYQLVDEAAQVPEELRELLAYARRRGMTFDRAWRECIDAVLDGHTELSARRWRRMLDSQRDVWRRSYDRKADPAAGLGQGLDEEPSDVTSDGALVA